MVSGPAVAESLSQAPGGMVLGGPCLAAGSSAQPSSPAQLAGGCHGYCHISCTVGGVLAMWDKCTCSGGPGWQCGITCWGSVSQSVDCFEAVADCCRHLPPCGPQEVATGIPQGALIGAPRCSVCNCMQLAHGSVAAAAVSTSAPCCREWRQHGLFEREMGREVKVSEGEEERGRKRWSKNGGEGEGLR